MEVMQSFGKIVLCLLAIFGIGGVVFVYWLWQQLRESKLNKSFY